MAVRAVILDLFDTLVDLRMEDLPETTVGGRRTRSTLELLHGTLVRRVNHRTDLDLETFAQALIAVDSGTGARLREEGREFPTRERFREVLGRLEISEAGLAEELTATHMDAIRALARFVDHHADVIRELHARLRIGICSNFSHAPTALAILEDARILPHVDAAVISEEVGVRKPRAEIFEEVLRRLGVAPGEAVHVGDQLVADVEGAAAAGLRPVWLTRRARDPEADLRAHSGRPPAAIIRDLSELPRVLREL